jgi:enolase
MEATSISKIVKTGSLGRTDRVLLHIAEELGDKAVYGGKMR